MKTIKFEAKYVSDTSSSITYIYEIVNVSETHFSGFRANLLRIWKNLVHHVRITISMIFLVF